METALNKAKHLINQPTSSSIQQQKSFQSQSIDKFSSYNFLSPQKTNYLDKIYKLYLYYGSCWKFIESELNQDQFQNYFKFNNPKNFIYNSIRRSAKTLAKVEVDKLGKRRRLVNKDTLLSMLEIINQVQRVIMTRNLIPNQDSLLFTFKKNLLRFSLWEDSLSEEEIFNLIKLMKHINLKLRCLSIFKTKHRKNWKLSDRALQLIFSFDKIIVEEFGERISFSQSAQSPNQIMQNSIQYYSRDNQEESGLVNNLQQIQSFFKPIECKWGSEIKQRFQENCYQKQKIGQLQEKNRLSLFFQAMYQKTISFEPL